MNMSSEQQRLGNLTPNNLLSVDEELDANDLEVAMINESFEEQLKQCQNFYNSNLKSLFYGGCEFTDTTNDSGSSSKEQQPFPMAEIAAENVKSELTPLKFLPPITPRSDFEDNFDRGQQLDQELGRMMLEEDEKYFSDSPPLLLSPEEKHAYYNISSISFPPDQNSYFSFESPEDSDESADAAQAIAIDVVKSLFEDEPNNLTDVITSDAEEELIVSASILQVLRDDDTDDSIEEDMDDDPEMEKAIETAKDKEQPSFTEFELLSPPSRNDSMYTIASTMSASEEQEQTVPVIDSWEELAKEPEKVCSDGRALLKKIRAERKATQL